MASDAVREIQQVIAENSWARTTREEWIAGVNEYFNEVEANQVAEPRIVELEYDSIQTVAYTHRLTLDTDLWERMTGEVFDSADVDIEYLRDFVDWEGISETGGDILDEQVENLREV